MTDTDAADTIAVRNVLFIMCDQLRLDALSCYGGGVIDTPNIDRLASRGVRFDNAYVQGAVCGSSRMSFYTGRYVQSHGARWNQVPLALGQRTLGDHVRPLGVRPVLIGKTHMAADKRSLDWLGLDPDSPEAVYVAECGFEPEERDDGLHPEGHADPELAYNRFLREHGYGGDNPWHRAANSVLDEDGNRISAGCYAGLAVSGNRARRAVRDRLHDGPGHRVHPQRRRRALVHPPVVHQAALALRGVGPVPPDGRPPRPAGATPVRTASSTTNHPGTAGAFGPAGSAASSPGTRSALRCTRPTWGW